MRGNIGRRVALALALVLASVRQSAGDPIIYEAGLAVSVFASDPLLHGVNGLAFGTDGLYASVSGADPTGRGIIARITGSGTVQQVTGALGPPNISLSGIAVDRNGSILVGTETGANELWAVSHSGQQSLVYKDNGMTLPTDIRLDSNGDILVVERTGIRGVSRIARDGSSRDVVVRAADYGWTGAPTGIELGSPGRILVAYRDDGSIYVVPPVGTPSKYAQVPSSNSQIALALGPDGSLYASNDQKGQVYKISSSGDWRPFASAIDRPMCMAFDSAGNMYIAAQAEGIVYKVAPDPTAIGPVAFFDGTFNASDWESSIVSHVGAGTVTAWQEASGGDPGQFMDVQLHLPPGSSPRNIWTFERRIGATYDPRTQGAIATIDYSEEAIQLYSYPLPTGHSDGQATGAAIRQDGVVYYGGYALVPETTWTTKSFTGLVASDFHSASDPSVHPDFSSSGSPIELGFYRANSEPSQWSATTRVGIDNWSFAVFPEAGAVIPEPLSMAFMGSAFVGVVAARLRHLRKRE
jgi:sugar lactone lactonase YvrE